MGRFRSAPGAKYYDSMDEYREGALHDGTPETSLFDIVEQFAPQRPVPWLTFVLGSGCLTPTEPTGTASDEEVAAVVHAGLEASGLDIESALEARVLTFFRALIDKKLPDSGGLSWVIARAGSSDPRVVPWSIAAIACVVAALATEELATLMNDSSYVVDRADKEVLRVPRHVDVSLFAEHLVDAQRAIASYKSDDSQGVPAYLSLLKSVQNGVQSATNPELWRSQVEALTGFAWHFVTDGTAIYPGWSDMLLFQAASSKLNRGEFERVPFLRRPVVENAKPLDENSLLLERLRRVTNRSLEGNDGARDDFYHRVAAVLLQQAGVRMQGSSQFPLATAFTASFDVELELALWSAIAGGEAPVSSFAIVAPVYVVDPETTRGGFNTELHWLWRVVTPGGGGDAGALVAPSDEPDSQALGPWQRIDMSRRVLDSSLRSLPIVVHLAGAPLLKMGSEVRELFSSPVGAVHHALLLDEHLATVQFAEDLLDTAGPGQLHSEFLRSATTAPVAPRFWAFVGTQLADPAIRFRLLANELRLFRESDQLRQKSAHSDSTAIGSEHGGVVINDWVPAAEREVFRWFGYDIVRGTALDLVPDLDDYLTRAAIKISSERGSRHGAA